MANVETVLGPIATDQLGYTLMHEHVFVLTAEIQNEYPSAFDEDVRVGEAVTKLKELKEHGVSTIVDLTVFNMGRNVGRIAKVAEQAGINIVVATGFYTFNDLWPAFYYRVTPEGANDALVDLFVKDLTVGIGETKIRASILKCATDTPGVTPGVDRVLRACARAHRLTGAPISTHTNALLKRGLDQQEVFRQEGVDLSRVVIGHCGDTTDLDYLQELLDAGSYIGMDRFGMEYFLPNRDRVDTLVALCEKGYASQIVLSHDHVCHVDWSHPLPPCSDPIVIFKQLPRPPQTRWKYTCITDEIIPDLRARGVSDEDIDTMMVKNPKKILAGGAAY
jgi:phosphotriesterase-related protein